MLDALFANLALGFSQQIGAPFVDATARWPGTPAYDDGGSIATPDQPNATSR